MDTPLTYYAELGIQFRTQLDLLWQRLGEYTGDDQEDIHRFFPDVIVAPGCELHLHHFECVDFGDTSYFYTTNVKTQENRRIYEDLLVDREKPETLCSQIWLICMLSHANALLPCFWHGALSWKTFIFSEDTLNEVTEKMKKDRSELPAIETLYPQVEQLSENEVQVSCCYKAYDGGLVREIVNYTLDGNRIKEAHYDCKTICDCYNGIVL